MDTYLFQMLSGAGREKVDSRGTKLDLPQFEIKKL
jgi:hypothetical protein